MKPAETRSRLISRVHFGPALGSQPPPRAEARRRELLHAGVNRALQFVFQAFGRRASFAGLQQTIDC